jgi:hypothetical protein
LGGNTRVWRQSLALTRQVLLPLAHFALVIFWAGSHGFVQVAVGPQSFYLCLLHTWDYKSEPPYCQSSLILVDLPEELNCASVLERSWEPLVSNASSSLWVCFQITIKEHGHLPIFPQQSDHLGQMTLDMSISSDLVELSGTVHTVFFSIHFI